MPDFTLAVGAHDPHGFSAEGEAEAVRYAVGYIEARHARELAELPQEVVTLLGDGGLVTGPSERIDAFVRRVPGDHPDIDPDRLQPGDADAPDCNGGSALGYANLAKATSARRRRAAERPPRQPRGQLP